MASMPESRHLLAATPSTPTRIRTHRAGWAVLAILTSVHLLVLSSNNLDGFPGLHGDEARFGRMALEIQRDGLTSPHGFNRYTGALFASAMGWAFAFFPPGIASLRGLGVCLTMATILGFACWLAFQHDLRRAALWLAAAAGCTLLVTHARIAWEVCALQTVFVVMVLAVMTRTEAGANSQPIPILWRTVYVSAVWLGVSNHFIFLTVALAATFGAMSFARPEIDRRANGVLALTVTTLAASTLLVVAKTITSDAIFVAHRYLIIGLWLLAIPLIVAVSGSNTWTDRLVAMVAHSPLVVAHRWGIRLSLAWLAVSGLGLGFIQVLAGGVIHRRLGSDALPLGIEVLGFMLAGVGYALGIGIAARTVNRTATLPVGVVWLRMTFLFWPICLAMTGRSQTAVRYYLPYALIFLALIVEAARSHPQRSVRRVLFVTLSGFIGLSAFLWPATQTPTPPLNQRFLIGNHFETAKNFAPLDQLADRAESAGFCRFEGNYFIAEPLRFIADAYEWPCRTDSTFRVEYCDRCAPNDLIHATVAHPR